MKQTLRDRVRWIIRKHYGKQSHFKTRGWEQCGYEIQQLIRYEQERFSFLHYSEMCDKQEKVRLDIENEYESYFKVGAYYAWVTGNSKLKQLLDY